MNVKVWKRDLALLILVILAVVALAVIQRHVRSVSPEEAHVYDMTP